MLFQDDALLPWKTARDNVALGLELQRRRARQSALAQADNWLDRLGLAGFGIAIRAISAAASASASRSRRCWR